MKVAITLDKSTEDTPKKGEYESHVSDSQSQSQSSSSTRKRVSTKEKQRIREEKRQQSIEKRRAFDRDRKRQSPEVKEAKRQQTIEKKHAYDRDRKKSLQLKSRENKLNKECEKIRKKRKRTSELIQAQKDCIDFKSTCMHQDANFSDYTKNPQTAACLYHCNSGNDKFSALEDILVAHSKGEDITSLPCYQELIKEIQEEVLSPDELQDRLQSFLLDQGKYCSWDNRKHLHDYLQGLPHDNVGAQHLCCGMCGITTVQG
jgi:hypothetical protein